MDKIENLPEGILEKLQNLESLKNPIPALEWLPDGINRFVCLVNEVISFDCYRREHLKEWEAVLAIENLDETPYYRKKTNLGSAMEARKVCVAWLVELQKLAQYGRD